MLVDRRAQRRAEPHLAHARPPDVAPERDERRLRPAETLGRGDRHRDSGERLDVLHERGPALEADGEGQRRLRPRPGLATLERLEERRLLARDVAVVPAADLDSQPVERGPGERRFERPRRRVERSLEEHDRLAGARGSRREPQPFDHVVRPAQHHEAVLERAGLALGAVRDDERPAALGPHGLPLPRRREPAAPAPAQPGLLQALDEGFRGGLVEVHQDDSQGGPHYDPGPRQPQGVRGGGAPPASKNAGLFAHPRGPGLESYGQRKRTSGTDGRD